MNYYFWVCVCTASTALVILFLTNSLIADSTTSHIWKAESITLLGCNVNLGNLFKKLKILGCKRNNINLNIHQFTKRQSSLAFNSSTYTLLLITLMWLLMKWYHKYELKPPVCGSKSLLKLLLNINSLFIELMYKIVFLIWWAARPFWVGRGECTK